MNDTTITMVGRIVDVPRRRLTEAGISVLNMRVGSTARRYDRESQGWIDGESLFVNVTCWRTLADNVSRSLVQGDAVVVHGRLFTREYEHNGQRRSSYDMEAQAIGPDLTWGRVEYVRTKRDPITHEVRDRTPADSAPEYEVAGDNDDAGQPSPSATPTATPAATPTSAPPVAAAAAVEERPLAEVAG